MFVIVTGKRGSLTVYPTYDTYSAELFVEKFLSNMQVRNQQSEVTSCYKSRQEAEI